MDEPVTEHLRILVAGAGDERVGRTATRVAGLGHDVVAGEIPITASTVTADEWPDMALVNVGREAGSALELVERLVTADAFPVVVVTEQPDPALVRAAAARGAYASVTHGDPASWQAAIEFAARRFGDYRRLAAAFERRAVIERAKGILMERHSIDERRAFEVLRRHARDANQRVVDVATHVIASHAMLPRI
jgi:AmiR/NasT family two-component response regulator